MPAQPPPSKVASSSAQARGSRDGDPRTPARPGLLGLVGPLLVVAGTGVASYSVVRYELRIVAVYTALTVVLALALVLRRSHVVVHRAGWALTLVVAGAVAARVPTFTHIQPASASPGPAVLGGTAVLTGLLLLVPWRRSADLALAVAVTGYVVAATRLIQLDPAPRIDVWVILQQGADGLLQGRNLYTQAWTGSPGVQDAFTYLPWTAVLLAPGRWVAGDVRWALVAVAVVTAVLVRLLPGRPLRADAGTAGARSSGSPAVAAAAVGALLLLLPGTATQVEQAWTEPLLLACLTGATLALVRGRLLVAVLCFALGMACKQHLALLLPLLAAWPRFGARRAVATAGVAGVLVLPWAVADPAAMWRDTVGLLVTFPPLKFADTLYIAAIRELAWTPPFWLTGAVVGGTVVLACLLVRRRNPDPAAFLRWFALVLLVANLTNKQAFYNQYWLVAALVLLSWAVPAGARDAGDRPEAERGGDDRPEAERGGDDRPEGQRDPATASR